MGDRAVTTRPKELEEKLEKMRKHKATKVEKPETKRRATGEAKSIIQATEELDTSHYTPKTRETRQAYESLLHFIQQPLGDLSTDMLKSCADEILAILKDEHKKDSERKKLIEEVMGTPISSEQLAKLISIGKSITDWADTSAAPPGEAMDEELGVAVVFDAEEEEEDEGSESEEFVLKEDEEEEAEAGDNQEENLGGTIGVKGEDGAARMEIDRDELDPKDIDAYWLQRQISKFIEDPLQSQKMADDVLAILGRGTARDVDNNLVPLLGTEHFDLVKLLRKNRWKVVYCTRLGRAQTPAEREAIEAEMRAVPELQAILDALTGKTAPAAGARAKRAREKKEAKPETIVLDEDEKRAGVPGRGRGDAAKGRTLLDLDSLAFQAGAHFMSNKGVKLPAGSVRVPKKGYEEIHIPAAKTPAFDRDERLISVSEMPKWAQPAFERVKQLNRVQSRLYHAALFTHENLLLCAPTGSGKTNVAMLAMLHEIGLNRNEDGSVNLDAFKIIYVAPMKSLVHEMVGNFSERLKSFGIAVRELTGDQNLTKQQIAETQVIVTTPEKWDIITRKAGDRTYTQLVKLIILDEIHLLHDDRGPVLEALVARTIRQIEATQENIRLVGLSATLPNYEDVATFLRVKKENLFAFDNSYRPCPLEQQYIGITEKKGMKRYQLMNDITYEKVMEQAGRNQVLIFVHSRKDTVKTAKALRDMALANDALAKFLGEDEATRAILQDMAEREAKSPDLRDLLPYGFAIHHAGLTRLDRELVEDLFANGRIQVLVSTATLAWGVNLPAHTVIIKGTQIYSPEKGRWVELSPLDVMQMLGRAGRPAFDTYGEGVVITSERELRYYLSLLNHQLPIESQLISRLPDMLNAEIVLGTVSNLHEAVTWLGYTYLYICMLRNPTLYGIPQEKFEADRFLEAHRYDLAHTAATILDKSNLIKYDRKAGTFQVTDLGRVASHYYVTHGSMATFNEHLKPSMSDIEICRLFSLSSEFKYVSVREEERVELENLLNRVPIPVKEGIEEPSAKVNVLLQAYISRLRLEGFALQCDMVYITQSAGRIMRALFEIALKRGWARLANKLLTFCKMVDKRMWTSQSPLRQFKGIPEEIIKKLERKDYPFERLYDLNAQEIGELIMYPAQGKTIHRFVHQFPRLELSAHVQPVTRSTLKIELTLTPEFNFDEKIHQNAEPFWIFVEDVDQEVILHSEYFLLKKKFASEEHVVTFTVPLHEPIPPHYFVRVVSDRWLGSETVLPVSFRHLIMPEKFAPPTELLDLQPVSIASIRNPALDQFYGGHIRQLNAIQTQAYPALYTTDDNVLLCAPTGSGKTLCAELALLRMFGRGGEGPHRAVYVAAKPEIVKERLRDWQAKFGEKLGKTVSELTGELAVDLKLLERSQIVLATPERWDLISRRWKQRRAVQGVRLFIVDEVHLLGFEGGHTLEVVVSRMRYMAQQLAAENPDAPRLRIVALGSSLANAKDVGDWLGCTQRNIFNFHPNVRPVPLEIHLQGFDIPHFSTRQMAMLKPVLNAVQHHAARDRKPVMVFVPSRKEAAQLAHDLRIASEAEEMGGAVGRPAFLNTPVEDIQPYLQRVKSKPVREFLEYGIALYHEGLAEVDREIVERLYTAAAVQVLIATHDVTWSLNLTCHLLVIMGTQYYDGKEHGYVDYPIVDLLQMMGRASRPNLDETAVCVVLCHAPKKDFYKKFLYEPLPIESHLDHFLADHMNAEVVAKVIENKQDAVDYLTWTFLYRRLTQNPNYYGLQGVSHRHISDHLSELVENTLADLERCKCISIIDEMDVTPLNLGMIASYYSIKYTTIELFSSSLTAKTRMKGLIDLLSRASEFDRLAVRRHEAGLLKKLAAHLPLKVENARYTDPHTKAHVLFQAHFSRRQLASQDLEEDRRFIVETATRLLQAVVDVISSNGWLAPALAAMELSQMMTQAVWDSDPVLRQLPHLTQAMLDRLKEKKVETIFDLMELDDQERRNALKELTGRQLQDVARVCNAYPNIDLSYDILDKDNITTGDQVLVQVQLEREGDDAATNEVPQVYAPYYPRPRPEGWWLVIGDQANNHLISIKRVTFAKSATVKLDFTAPSEPGRAQYTLFFMCDSYTGCDQEYPLEFEVKGGAAPMQE
jgi:pre-mRNA-splicing helicase BRR2